MLKSFYKLYHKPLFHKPLFILLFFIVIIGGLLKLTQIEKFRIFTKTRINIPAGIIQSDGSTKPIETTITRLFNRHKTEVNHTHPSHKTVSDEHKLEHKDEHDIHHNGPFRNSLKVPKSRFTEHPHSKHEYNKNIQKYKDHKVFPVYDEDELTKWGHTWNDCEETPLPKWSKYKIKSFTTSPIIKN